LEIIGVRCRSELDIKQFQIMVKGISVINKPTVNSEYPQSKGCCLEKILEIAKNM